MHCLDYWDIVLVFLYDDRVRKNYNFCRQTWPKTPCACERLLRRTWPEHQDETKDGPIGSKLTIQSIDSEITHQLGV